MYGKLKNILKNLNDFDWLVLTDIFAADFFLELLREIEFDLFELDSLTVCALGEAVSDRLRFDQIHSDVIPSKIENGCVLEEISGFAAESLENLRFLVVKEKSVSYSFVEELKALKANIEELAIYQGSFGIGSPIIKLKTLLKNGAADEFVFSSAEDIVSLKLLFPGEDLALVLGDTKISATSETIFQALLENSVRPLYFHRN